MKRTANMLIRKLFSSVRFDTLWKESWQLQPGGQEWPAPGSISEVLVAHRHGHLLMYYLCRPLCSNRRLKKLQQTQDSTQSWLFADSCPKETENHRAQWWKDNTNQLGEASRGCKGRGAHRGLVRGRGGGGRCAEGHEGQHRKVLASQATWEGGQASGSRTPHPLKSSPETYRPEGKSWWASNSSWKLCSALYARMVHSPRREDAKWENTGLCAGEAETNTWQRKSGRLDARKPTASHALWSHVPTKGTPGATWRAIWGRKDDAASERILHVILKFLLILIFILTTWKWNILFESFF